MHVALPRRAVLVLASGNNSADDLLVAPELVNLVLQIGDEVRRAPLLHQVSQVGLNLGAVVPSDGKEGDVERSEGRLEEAQGAQLEVDSSGGAVVRGVVGGGENVEGDEREGEGRRVLGREGQGAVVAQAEVLVPGFNTRTSERDLS